MLELGATTVSVTVTSVPHGHTVDNDSISVNYSGGMPVFSYSISQPAVYSYELYSLSINGSITSSKNDNMVSSDSFYASWSYGNGSWTMTPYGDFGNLSISKSIPEDSISIFISFNVSLTILEYDADGKQVLFYAGNGNSSAFYSIAAITE